MSSTPESAPRVPGTLQECLQPLLTGAVKSSALSYAWALKHGSLMRASFVMDMAESIAKECEKIIAAEKERAKAATAAGNCEPNA